MALHPGFENRPIAQRQMLNAIKKRGALSAEELAKISRITISGVRQHLALLEQAGLVMHQSQSAGRGRPKHHYQLTELADALYPRMYSELTNELLNYLLPEQIESIFAQRRERRLHEAQARIQAHKTLKTQVEELTRILDEDGYLAEVIADGKGYRILEHNCAIFAVAQKYGQACTSELEFIQAALPNAKVQRVAHMMAAGHVCAYLIMPDS